MTTEETIERLTLEVEELQGKMADASRLAAHDDIAGHGDPLSSAHELLEHRELLKLKRIALTQAKQIAEQEVVEATRVEREGVRDEICSLTDELESEATKMRNGIRRLGKNFKRIVEIEKEIKGLGQNAADWPAEVFRYRSPGESPYRYLINSLTVELDLNGFHINGWPNQYQASQLADIAECFRDYLYQREEWRHRFDEVIEETNHA
jgi:hypothetical protein